MKKLLSAVLSLGFIVCTVFLNPAFAKKNTFSDPTFGKKTAPVTIEIFIIYECPHCATMHNTLNSPEIQRLITRGEVQVILKDLRENGAAQAVNAALALSKTKGKKMVDILFSQQAEWSAKSYPLATFISYAKSLNINLKAFVQAYFQAENSAEIQADLEEAQQRKVSGSPTYFINGEEHVGAVGAEELLQQINAAK